MSDRKKHPLRFAVAESAKVNRFSTGYFAAIYRLHDKQILLTERPGGWNLPGGGPQNDDELSPAVILPRAVRCWTGFEVSRIRGQIGPNFPTLMGDTCDTASVYWCEVSDPFATPEQGPVKWGWFSRESIRDIRLMGSRDQPGRMAQMIYDSFRILDVPDDMFSSPGALPDYLNGMAFMEGVFAANLGGTHLVEFTQGIVKVWRRISPVIENERVVGEQHF